MKIEEFIEYERQNNLFNLRYLGVNFWKITRQTAYNLLSDNKVNTSNTTLPKKLKNRIIIFLEIIKSMIYVRFNRRTSARIMILTSSAFYVDQDGNRLDRIMNQLILREENSIVINLYSRNFKPFDFLTHGRVVHHYDHPIRILQNFILYRVFKIFLNSNYFMYDFEEHLINFKEILYN